MMRLSSLLLIMTFLSSPLTHGSALSDKAVETAEKFQRYGRPDHITQDDGLQFMKFEKMSTGSKSEQAILFEGVYSYYKNATLNQELIESVEINWGDGNTTYHAINGQRVRVPHTYVTSDAKRIFDVTIGVITANEKHVEEAKAVVSRQINTVEKSGRYREHKVIWNQECDGFIENDVCYVMEEVIRFTDPVDKNVSFSSSNTWTDHNVSHIETVTYEEIIPTCPGEFYNGVCSTRSEATVPDYSPAIRHENQYIIVPTGSVPYAITLYMIFAGTGNGCAPGSQFCFCGTNPNVPPHDPLLWFTSQGLDYYYIGAPLCSYNTLLYYCLDQPISIVSGSYVCGTTTTEVVWTPVTDPSYINCDTAQERDVSYAVANGLLTVTGSNYCTNNVVAKTMCFEPTYYSQGKCEYIDQVKVKVLEMSTPGGTYTPGDY